jgi:hypothetical protein
MKEAANWGGAAFTRSIGRGLNVRSLRIRIGVLAFFRLPSP